MSLRAILIFSYAVKFETFNLAMPAFHCAVRKQSLNDFRFCQSSYPVVAVATTSLLSPKVGQIRHSIATTAGFLRSDVVEALSHASA